MERDNQLKPALAKFRFAGSMLEELKKNNGDWQPAIVDYRSRKIGEAILRVQSKIDTQTDLAASAQPPPDETVEPALPGVGPAEPSVEIGARPPPAKSVDVQAAIQDATKELRDRVEALEAELKEVAERNLDRAKGEIRDLRQTAADQRRTGTGQRRPGEEIPGRERSARPVGGRPGIAPGHSIHRQRRPEGGGRAAGRDRAIEKSAGGRPSRPDRGGKGKHRGNIEIGRIPEGSRRGDPGTRHDAARAR